MNGDECLWTALDCGLKCHFIEQLGPDSEYLTLNVQHVATVAFREMSDWERWALENDLPAIAIQGRLVSSDPEEHGAAHVPLGKRYAYLAAGIVEGEMEEALRDAKILCRRIEKALSIKRPAFAQVKVDGESVHYIEVTSAEVTLARKRDSLADSWFGIGMVGFRIHGGG